MLAKTKIDEDTATSTVRGRIWPTPIWVPRRLRRILILVAILALVVALALVTWRVPLALVTVVGGLALATVLSFPVHLLSRLMPRRSRGLAVVVTFLTIVGLIVLATLFVVPQLARQSEMLTEGLSSSMSGAERYLLTAFELLDERGLLPGTPEQALSRIAEDLSNGAGALAGALRVATSIWSREFSASRSPFSGWSSSRPTCWQTPAG